MLSQFFSFFRLNFKPVFYINFRVSPKTVLTFCTHGVLLRTIFADPSLLNSTTHIVVDELDEFDLFTKRLTENGQEIHQLNLSEDNCKPTRNLLLGILHKILPQYSHLKLIFVVNLNTCSVISSSIYHPNVSKFLLLIAHFQ